MIDHKNVIGLVKWFNDSKGYGFIEVGNTLADGSRKVKVENVYAHYTAIAGDGFKTLAEDQEVEFDLTHSPKGPIATNIRKIIIP